MSTYKKRQILKALEGHEHEYKLTIKVSGTVNASNHLGITPQSVLLLSEMLDDEGNLNPQNLDSFSNDALLKELENRGFYTQSIFNVSDVREQLEDLNIDEGTAHTLTDAQCKTVLELVFSNVSGLNEEIRDRVEEILLPDTNEPF